MAFPSNPSDGAEHVAGNKTFVYNAASNKWKPVQNAASTTVIQEIRTEFIAPATSEAVSLGTPEKKFSELHLSGNTIYLGDAVLGSDSEGNLATNAVSLEGGKLSLKRPVENLTMEVQANVPGHGHMWTWSWPESLLYARDKVADQPQSSVNLYRGSTYVINNYAYTQYGNMTQPHTAHIKAIEGAGVQNDVIPYTIQTKLNPFTGQTQDTQVFEWTIPEDFSTSDITLVVPTGIEYNVEFQNVGAYTFVGTGSVSGTADGDNPDIGPLYRGATYTFNINATGHPFYFTTDDGTSFSSGTYSGEYINGVTGSRTETGTVTFTVPADAPDTLYYQCGIHGAMRGTIRIADLAVITDTDDQNAVVLFWQHGQEGHLNEIRIKDKPDLPASACVIYDGTEFVAQDFNTYLNNIPQVTTKIEDISKSAALQQMSLTGTSLAITDGNTVDLAPIQPTLGLNGNVLSTSAGSSVDLSTIVPDSASPDITTMTQSGSLEVMTGDNRWYAPKDLTINKIIARVDTAPTGADLILTIRKVSGETTDSSTITITDGGSKATDTTPISMLEDDYIVVDITQVGTGVTGADLKVTFTYS